MKTYFAVWEAYSDEWKLSEKGTVFLFANDTDHLMNLMEEYCEDVAKARNVNYKQVMITSIQPI